MTSVAPNTTSSSSDSTALVLLSFNAILGTVGIFGNGVVLVVMIGVKRLRNVTNLFIVNQSIIDMATSILLFANYILPPAPLPSNNAVAAATLCAIWNSHYLFWSSVGASTFNLVLITLERYFAVVYPITYRNKFKYGRAVVMACVPWVLGFALEAHWATVNHYIAIDGGQCVIEYESTHARAISGVVTFIVQFFLPIVIMVLVYARIERSLRSRVGATTGPPNGSNNPPTATDPTQNPALVPPQGNTRDAAERQSQQQPQPAPSAFRGKARKNVIKTLLLVSVIYIICWTPNQILYVYLNLGGDIDYNGFLYNFTVYWAFLNICVNPFIYAFKYQKFQQGLRGLLGMKRATNMDLASTS